MYAYIHIGAVAGARAADMNAHLCIHPHIYRCTYTLTCILMHIVIYVYIYVYIHIHILMYMHTYIQARLLVRELRMGTLFIVMQLPRRNVPGQAGMCIDYAGCQIWKYVLYGNALHRHAVVKEEYAGTSRCVYF